MTAHRETKPNCHNIFNYYFKEIGSNRHGVAEADSLCPLC